MNKEDLETIEFWKDCIKHLEKEFQYPNYLGYFITIRDKECEYLKTTLNLIDKLQQKVNQLESTINDVRKECETNIIIFDSGKSYSIAIKDVSKDILKILDKVGGSNE